ncbi:hypothetical protein [Bradyrhizobium sp. th.b2]|uniref:hypothetical protein n=1 Tax=Bradyrhizobium sp. th-b2 TaxID=172088 RepID=UPI00048AA2F1|nr:hypothetical protein [Bradyrhizobium sp. th.b2]
MKVLFAIWGSLGLLINIAIFMLMLANIGNGIGVIGISSFAAAIVLLWIGVMVFFGLGSLVFRNQQHTKFSPLERWEAKGENADVRPQQRKIRQPNALDRYFGDQAPG